MRYSFIVACAPCSVGILIIINQMLTGSIELLRVAMNLIFSSAIMFTLIAVVFVIKLILISEE